MQKLRSVRKIAFKGEISNSNLFNALPSRLYKTLKPSHRPKRVSLTGHTLYLDPHDALNLSWNGGVYEPFETKIMLESLRNGDVVIDLGAFIGYYTILFADKVGAEGKVFAFEAAPDNFALLSRNVKEYNQEQGFPYKAYAHPHLEIYDSNIHIEQCAVTNEHDSSINVFECETNSGMNRIYPSKYCNSQKNRSVRTIKLDKYFSGNAKIDLIKMDLEGSELGALEGMTDLLHENKKNIKIFLEFCPASIEEYGRQPKDVFEYLYSHGMNIYHLDRKSKQVIKPIVTQSVGGPRGIYNDLNIEQFIDTSNKITTNLLAKFG